MLNTGLLESCGLNQSEQVVLQHLLEKRGGPGGLLAKRLGMKRSTVYTVLASLEQLGLVIRRKEGSATIFSTIPPEQISEVLLTQAQERFETVRQASQLLGEQLKQYQRSATHNIAGYEISTAESANATYALLSKVLTGGDFSAIFDLGSATLGPAETVVVQFLEVTSETHAHIRDLLVEGPKVKWYLDQINNPNHKVKMLPRSSKMITDFILSEGSVFMTNYQPGQEMALEIRHPNYYDSMMTIFNALWDRLD